MSPKNQGPVEMTEEMCEAVEVYRNARRSGDEPAQARQQVRLVLGNIPKGFDPRFRLPTDPPLSAERTTSR